MRFFPLLLIALTVLAGCGGGDGQEEEADRELVVFAAASLTDVTRAVADTFEAAHPGVRVTVAGGPSSTLAHQIDRGAPAAVFLSASPEWTDWLQERDRLDGAPVVLAAGRLVVVGPPGTPPLDGPEGVTGAQRLALADPAHVPAGQYARAALEAAGLWASVEDRVVPTADVRAAVAAVRAGSADLAFSYASDAVVAGDAVAVVLAWPDALSPPVRFTGGIVRGGGAEARAFLDALAAPEARPVWARYGFDRVPAP
ncbi:MAG TPA: molybdate ABC transporter substrate-binding protein [Rhodothermales bacterium]|nr:molybdate ABC transporter substrate-binding protein [Rhodothermales bacterium]